MGAVLHVDRNRDIASPVRSLIGHLGRTVVSSSAVLALAACGNTYRPVVSSINPVGPAGQPTKYAVAVSSNGASSQGLVTLIDYAGDTVVNTTLIGVNPKYFQLASTGFEGYTINGDGTLNSFSVSSGLLASQVLTSTLPSGANPQSIYSQGTYLYIPEAKTTSPAIAELTGLPPAVGQEFPVSAAPIYVVGANGSPRAYGLLPVSSDGAGSAVPIETNSNTTDQPLAVGLSPSYGVMTADSRRAFVLNTGSGNVTVINAQGNALDQFQAGVAVTGFSISGNTVTVAAANTFTAGTAITLSGLSVGTYLNQQTFTVLASGLSGSQFQAVSPSFAHANVGATVDAGTVSSSSIAVGTAPVWADFAPTLNELFVLNQGTGTSQGSVSVINIPLCSQVTVTTNPNCDTTNPIDATGFGTVLATIPVGINPVMIAVLQDGTQAFVANAGNAALPCSLPAAGGAPNCSVSVINLSTQTVIATIPFIASSNETDSYGHGRPKWIAATTGTPTGKAYVTAGDSSDISIIRSEDETVSTHLSLQGFGVAVRVSAQ